MQKKVNKKVSGVSRREFIKTSAAVSMAAAFSPAAKIFAAGSDKIRVGVIGCGGRGSGAAVDCIKSADGVEIVAIGELFKDHLDKGINRIKKKLTEEKLPADKLKVTEETSFVGFDAYKKVVACDVDMVIIATPPHFRPTQLKAAIEAGKHVFMEKPVAVDAPGVRSIIATSQLAESKGLAIVAGTQRKHQKHYLEIIKRIHKGDIGEIVAAQCYWNMEGLWLEAAKNNLANKEKLGWSDMEYQIRNWLFLVWLSGDHIVEQHVHNVDVVNWAIGSHPIKAMGVGGREVRTGPEFGNIFDHFAIEFEYPNGARLLSMCRQTEGCIRQVSERVVGTKGSVYTDGSVGYIEGQNAYKFEGESPNPYVQEHTDLIASIRRGNVLNEGRRVAESTMTAIMGRMSAYTGRALQWDWVMNASKLDLSPPKYEFGDLPLRPVAVPGKTKLV
ncbi:MAG: Gfo/Idh/MocA family oxidoreductase [Planctomycetota bacterium]|jgi:predicted dehydrogenase